MVDCVAGDMTVAPMLHGIRQASHSGGLTSRVVWRKQRNTKRQHPRQLCWFLPILVIALQLSRCGSQPINPLPTSVPALPTPAPTSTILSGMRTTNSPTLKPTLSVIPSEMPSESAKPSHSVQPTQPPTRGPTGSPTPAPTSVPTETPTKSLLPTSIPSVNPTSPPTVSFAPSMVPSVSSAPSVSFQPSSPPTANPTTSSSPTDMPSLSPSIFPSNFPSTSRPTVHPTPMVEQNQTATLSMTVYGMNRSVKTFAPKKFDLITGGHVKNFWKGFGTDRSLFYVKLVETTFVSETELGNNALNGYPPPRRILFKLNVQYRLRDLDSSSLMELQRLVGRNLGADAFEEYIYKWRGMLTLPFEQDSLSYLKELDQELGNNTNFLWLDFEGVQRERPPTAVISSVTSALAVLVIAGGIFYVYTKRGLDDDAIISPTGSDSPIVGAVIGVNAKEDILISESYDDDYVHFGANHQNESLLLRNNSRQDDELDLPLDLVQKVSSPVTAISDIESPMEPAERPKHASPSQGTVFSNGTNVSARTSQAEVVSVNESKEGEGEKPVDDVSHGGSCAPSFVGDFQMEIQDLED